MFPISTLTHEWDDALFESSPVPMALVAPDHRFVRCNASFCRLVGYSKAELGQRTWKSITHPDDLYGDEAGSNSVQVDPENRTYSISKRYISKNGSIVWCNLFVRAIWDAGKFACFFVTAIESAVGRPDAAPARSEPVSIREWARRNPKDAALVGFAVAAFLGRDNIVEIIKALTAGGK